MDSNFLVADGRWTRFIKSLTCHELSRSFSQFALAVDWRSSLFSLRSRATSSRSRSSSRWSSSCSMLELFC